MSSSTSAVTAAAPKRVSKKWTPEEDQKLIECVRKYGAEKWDEIARKSGLSRTGRSCRMRWKDHKQPGINKQKFTKDEDEKIRYWLKVYGKKWSKIALKLQQRNGNQVKNYWNSHLSKKIPVMSNEEELIEISGNFGQCDDLLESSKKIPVMSNEEELIEISGNFSQYDDDLESSKKIPVSNEKELIGISSNFGQYDDDLESSKKIPVMSNEKELIGISGNFSQYDDDLESSKKIPVSNEKELIGISGNFLESSKKIPVSNEEELIGISGNFLESSKKIPVSKEKELIGISGNFLESSKKIPVSNEEELIGISGNFSQCDDLLEEFIRSLENENENVRGDGFDLEMKERD